MFSFIIIIFLLLLLLCFFIRIILNIIFKKLKFFSIIYVNILRAMNNITIIIAIINTIIILNIFLLNLALVLF